MPGASGLSPKNGHSYNLQNAVTNENGIRDDKKVGRWSLFILNMKFEPSDHLSIRFVHLEPDKSPIF